ncbi:MAG: D-alanyl-D-alanine carboxypeptidase [Bacilli bacterium]|nr:D-alanyl-D-alanine carboxypeptidase [Bacilli bacterium]
MIKKILIIFMILLFLCPINIYAEESLLANAKSGMLIEATTGKILYEKNKDERVSVASMTKMVAQIIILENIEKGTLSWDEKITVSKNAADMGGSQIWLQQGEQMTVRDLMKGITMASANDATVALAERIAGTEQAFVEKMNKKVKDLGLKNTNFVNPTGLDEDNHYSSAYDMSVIAQELLKHEDILEFSSVYEDYIRQDTPNKFWVVNTNKLIRFYDGADGLKTGFTDNAGYCMAVTAKRDGMRLIAITLGEEKGSVRNTETSELLDYGFNLYKVDKIKNKGDIIEKVKIDKGTKDKIKISVEEDVVILKKKTEISKKYDLETKINDISLPIKKGDVLGKLLVKDNGKVVKEVDLVALENVEKLGYFKTILETIKDVITGRML